MVANTTAVKAPDHITFDAPQTGRAIKKYLLRLINTSFDTTFVFSIDNHKLRIVSADFVPIQPYSNESVLIGIGQRYNVIVKANPLAYNETSPLPSDGNYWMRTYVSQCNRAINASKGYERTGILRYNNSSTSNPSSQPWHNISTTCSDEKYSDLHPIVPWQVKDPVNGPSGENFDFWFMKKPSKPPYPLAHWTLGMESEGFSPIRVDYSDPTVFHFDKKGP